MNCAYVSQIAQRKSKPSQNPKGAQTKTETQQQNNKDDKDKDKDKDKNKDKDKDKDKDKEEERRKKIINKLWLYPFDSNIAFRTNWS